MAMFRGQETRNVATLQETAVFFDVVRGGARKQHAEIVPRFGTWQCFADRRRETVLRFRKNGSVVRGGAR